MISPMTHNNLDNFKHGWLYVLVPAFKSLGMTSRSYPLAYPSDYALGLELP